ncbi:MAG TPA: T9SS type A sorting domain-containing protein, partial [Acidobacteriota bacterium]|nr:T9SS type A sorting domain-containing protein [Acidobacteriota bacterium]
YRTSRRLTGDFESTERGDHVNKAKGHILTGALVLGVILLGAQTGFTQVAGRVAASGGGAVASATVQVWDTYPGGTLLGAATTNGAGEFALLPTGKLQIDLRVIKNGYYPTIVRALPEAITNTLMELAAAPPTPVGMPWFQDAWGLPPTLDGASVRTGDYITAADPDGFVCGLLPWTGGDYYLFHIYGDDPLTPEDEGARSNEEITFAINGIPAVGSTDPFLWADRGSTENNLSVLFATIPGATVTGFLDKDGKAGSSAYVIFTLTNTGGTTETFTVSAQNDQGWTMVITPTKSESVPLNSGASSAIVVEVQIPPGTPDQIVEVRLMAVADSYGSANSGAFTNLNVTTISDIWDGQGGHLLPSGFGLAQNYPNPFNPSTLISFNLEYAGQVQLEVVNLLGQRVRTLVNGYRPAGVNSEIWDGRDQNGITVSSGIYFYRLAQDGLSQTRKMVLLK